MTDVTRPSQRRWFIAAGIGVLAAFVTALAAFVIGPVFSVPTSTGAKGAALIAEALAAAGMAFGGTVSTPANPAEGFTEAATFFIPYLTLSAISLWFVAWASRRAERAEHDAPEFPRLAATSVLTGGAAGLALAGCALAGRLGEDTLQVDPWEPAIVGFLTVAFVALLSRLSVAGFRWTEPVYEDDVPEHGRSLPGSTDADSGGAQLAGAQGGAHPDHYALTDLPPRPGLVEQLSVWGRALQLVGAWIAVGALAALLIDSVSGAYTGDSSYGVSSWGGGIFTAVTAGFERLGLYTGMSFLVEGFDPNLVSEGMFTDSEAGPSFGFLVVPYLAALAAALWLRRRRPLAAFPRALWWQTPLLSCAAWLAINVATERRFTRGDEVVASSTLAWESVALAAVVWGLILVGTYALAHALLPQPRALSGEGSSEERAATGARPDNDEAELASDEAAGPVAPPATDTTLERT